MYPKKKMNYLAHPHSHTHFMLNSPWIPNKIGILPIWSKGIRFSSLPWRSGCFKAFKYPLIILNLMIYNGRLVHIVVIAIPHQSVNLQHFPWSFCIGSLRLWWGWGGSFLFPLAMSRLVSFSMESWTFLSLVIDHYKPPPFLHLLNSPNYQSFH